MKENYATYQAHPTMPTLGGTATVTNGSQKRRIFIESPNASKQQSASHIQNPLSRKALEARNFQGQWNEAYTSAPNASAKLIPFPEKTSNQYQTHQKAQNPQQFQQQQTMRSSRKIFGASPPKSFNKQQPFSRSSTIPTRQSLVRLVTLPNCSNRTKDSLSKQTALQNQGDGSIGLDEIDSHDKSLFEFQQKSQIKCTPSKQNAQRFVESKRIFAKIVEFLGFSDLLQLKYVCKAYSSYPYLKYTKKAMSIFITKGLDQKENYLLWNHFIHFDNVQSKHELQYYNYTLIPSSSDAEILQDSNRTLISRSEQIEGKRKEKLKKILRSVSHNMKEVGYVRGMNEIVGALIATDTFKENEIYWITLYLFRQLKLKELFSDGFPRLNILIFQLRIFMQNYTSEILGYLDSHDVPIVSFAAKWFLTIFSSEFPKVLLSKVWGLLLLDGWKTLISVSIGLLKIFEEDILNCKSADELTSLLKNLLPTRSINETVVIQKLIPILNQFKITNSLLNSLEKIYEKHPPYLRDSLIILLHRNRHLNNILDWKILPQAPHFKGQNSTLERLNAHTMVADYFNELKKMDNSTQHFTKTRSITSASDTASHYNSSHPIQRSAYQNQMGSSQRIHFSSEQKLQEQSNQINREVGILRQISKKLISIFTDDDQQHETSESNHYFKHNSVPITPSYSTTVAPTTTTTAQPSMRYYDQILGEIREVEAERCQTESEDLIKIGPQSKKGAAHTNHQPKTLKVLQCHRREESGIQDTTEFDGDSPAKAMQTQYQSVKKPNYIEAQNRNTRSSTEHDLPAPFPVGGDHTHNYYFKPCQIPSTPQGKFQDIDKHFSKLKTQSQSHSTQASQAQTYQKSVQAASPSINQLSSFISMPKPITTPFNPSIIHHQIPFNQQVNSSMQLQQKYLPSAYVPHNPPMNFKTQNSSAFLAQNTHNRTTAGIPNLFYQTQQTPSQVPQIISRK